MIPKGTLVMRKDSLQTENEAHHVPPGAVGVVTGRTKVHPRTGQEAVEVKFLEAVDRLGRRPRKLWFVRPEYLIPLD